MRSNVLFKFISILCVFTLLLASNLWTIPVSANDSSTSEKEINSLLSNNIQDESEMVQSDTISPQITPDDGTENLNNLNIEGVYPKKGNPKLDSALINIITHPGAPLPAAANISESSAGESTIRVIVESIPGSEDESAQAANQVGVIETEYNGLLQINVPVSRLSELAANQSIRYVRLPYEALPDVVSEGVSLVNATTWQSASYRGSGVKIGILDGGFSGYTALQSLGELPASITRNWSSAGGEGTSTHGAACAEIIFDIAPEANYYFARFSGDVEFGNAVDWLIAQDVDIISCSMGWPGAGPGNGTGPIDEIVDLAYNAGILWSQAAGNSAQMHWSGSFVSSDGNIWNDFASGVETNAISVSVGDPIAVSLSWNDAWGTSSNDYDLYLYDNSSIDPVAWSQEEQNGAGDPYEFLSYSATYTGTYYIAIAKYDAPVVKKFHLYSYYHDLEYQVAAGSIAVPADSTHVLTVGAVPWNNPTIIESFSSQGPNASGVKKPDIVTPDFVSTVTYGNSGFPGTSATAPCAAGAAALVKEAYPAYTQTQIKSYLESHVLDLGVTGKDNIFGSGRLILGTPPGILVFTTDPQNVVAGTPCSITIQTQDASGNPLNVATNTQITLSSSSTAGKFDTSSTGAFNGTITQATIPAGSNSISFYYKDTKAGTPTITVSTSGFASATQQETITASSANSLSISTRPAIGASVDAVLTTQPVILVKDLFGNPIGGVTVTASRGTTGTGELRGTLEQVTDASGLARFTDLGYNKSGEYFTLHFASDSLFVNSTSLGPIAAGAAAQIRVETVANGSGTIVGAQNITAGTTLKVYGVTRDQFGNYKGNPTNTTWTLTDKTDGVIDSDLSAATGANVTFTGHKVGTAVIHAVNGTLTAGNSGVITVTNSTTVDHLAIVTQPASTLSVDFPFNTAPVVTAYDIGGNPISGAGIVASRDASLGTGILGGTTTVTTNASGQAIFDNLTYNKLDAFKVRFTSNSKYVISNSVSPLSAGAPATLTISTAPVVGASVDVNLATQPKIQVKDQYSNLINGATVTASRGTGTGDLRGTLTAVSGSNGLAVFTDLGYNKSGEGFTIHFASGSVSIDSASLGPLTAGAATSISLATAPAAEAGASVDAILTTQPVILVVDQYNNPVSAKTVTASRSTGTGALRGTFTSVSGANGLATFTNLGYNKSGESFSIHFAQGSLTVDSDSMGPLAAGAATQLRVETAADGSGTLVGSQSMETRTSLTVYGVTRDLYDNFVGSPVGASWSLTSKTGNVLDADLIASEDGSSATFTPTKTGSAQIHAAITDLTSVDSGTITVTPVLDRLEISIQPASTASVDSPLTTAAIVAAYEADGTPISGVSITAELVSGSGALRGTLTEVTTANGQAVFDDLGYSTTDTFTIRFSAKTKSVTSSDISPLSVGAPAVLSLSTIPEIGASVDVALAKQPVILVADQFANPVSEITVTASRGSGTGVLRGTLTEVTVANGQAAFYDLGYNKSGENFSIRFTANNLTVESDLLGPLTVGAANRVRVETAANGTGKVVTAQNLIIGKKLTVYSITRDQFDNFIANTPAEAWSLTDISGSVVAGDLVAAADNLSAILTGNKAGKAAIHAAITDLTSVDSGLITVAASSGGGGGGGGGSPVRTIALSPSGFASNATLELGKDGTLSAAAQLQTADGKLALNVAANTRLLDKNGAALAALTVSPLTSTPEPPPSNALVMAYELGPEGATFNPPLTLTLKYGDLPDDVVVSTLHLVYWNGTSWIELPGSLDLEKGTFTASLSHFSKYALAAEVLEPARFTVADLTLSSEQVKLGEAVSISSQIVNEGEMAGKYIVTLKVNGAEEENLEINLEAGQSKTVTFQVKREYLGEYRVDINGKTRSFTVTAPPVTTVTVSPTPEKTTSPTPANTDISASPSATTSAASQPAEQNLTPPLSKWIWIGLAIGIVLVILVIATVRRKSRNF